jgi:hypothetical protein
MKISGVVLRLALVAIFLALGYVIMSVQMGWWPFRDLLADQRLSYYPGGVRETTFSTNGKTKIDSDSSVIFFVPGTFHSSENKQFDDFVELMPSGVGNIGVVGSNASIENIINHSRDKGLFFSYQGL